MIFLYIYASEVLLMWAMGSRWFMYPVWSLRSDLFRIPLNSLHTKEYTVGWPHRTITGVVLMYPRLEADPRFSKLSNFCPTWITASILLPFGVHAPAKFWIHWLITIKQTSTSYRHESDTWLPLETETLLMYKLLLHVQPLITLLGAHPSQNVNPWSPV